MIQRCVFGNWRSTHHSLLEFYNKFYFKAGCSERSRTTKFTKRLEKRREALQRDYINGDIEEREFLITIGSLTGKKVGNLRPPASGPEGTGEPLATEGPGGPEGNGSLRFKIFSKILFLNIFIYLVKLASSQQTRAPVMKYLDYHQLNLSIPDIQHSGLADLQRRNSWSLNVATANVGSRSGEFPGFRSSAPTVRALSTWGVSSLFMMRKNSSVRIVPRPVWTVL